MGKRNYEIRMSKLELMTKPERVTNERFSFVIPSSHNPVMLSEAKHLRLFSLGARRNEKDQRFFASLRMTVSKLFHRSTIRHLFVIRHLSAAGVRSRHRHGLRR